MIINTNVLDYSLNASTVKLRFPQDYVLFEQPDDSHLVVPLVLGENQDLSVQVDCGGTLECNIQRTNGQYSDPNLTGDVLVLVISTEQNSVSIKADVKGDMYELASIQQPNPQISSVQITLSNGEAIVHKPIQLSAFTNGYITHNQDSVFNSKLVYFLKPNEKRQLYNLLNAPTFQQKSVYWHFTAQLQNEDFEMTIEYTVEQSGTIATKHVTIQQTAGQITIQTDTASQQFEFSYKTFNVQFYKDETSPFVIKFSADSTNDVYDTDIYAQPESVVFLDALKTCDRLISVKVSFSSTVQQTMIVNTVDADHGLYSFELNYSVVYGTSVYGTSVYLQPADIQPLDTSETYSASSSNASADTYAFQFSGITSRTTLVPIKVIDSERKIMRIEHIARSCAESLVNVVQPTDVSKLQNSGSYYTVLQNTTVSYVPLLEDGAYAKFSVSLNANKNITIAYIDTNGSTKTDTISITAGQQLEISHNERIVYAQPADSANIYIAKAGDQIILAVVTTKPVFYTSIPDVSELLSVSVELAAGETITDMQIYSGGSIGVVEISSLQIKDWEILDAVSARKHFPGAKIVSDANRQQQCSIQVNQDSSSGGVVSVYYKNPCTIQLTLDFVLQDGSNYSYTMPLLVNDFDVMINSIQLIKTGFVAFKLSQAENNIQTITADCGTFSMTLDTIPQTQTLSAIHVEQSSQETAESYVSSFAVPTTIDYAVCNLEGINCVQIYQHNAVATFRSDGSAIIDFSRNRITIYSGNTINVVNQQTWFADWHYLKVTHAGDYVVYPYYIEPSTSVKALLQSTEQTTAKYTAISQQTEERQAVCRNPLFNVESALALPKTTSQQAEEKQATFRISQLNTLCKLATHETISQQTEERQAAYRNPLFDIECKFALYKVVSQQAEENLALYKYVVQSSKLILATQKAPDVLTELELNTALTFLHKPEDYFCFFGSKANYALRKDLVPHRMLVSVQLDPQSENIYKHYNAGSFDEFADKKIQNIILHNAQNIVFYEAVPADGYIHKQQSVKIATSGPAAIELMPVYIPINGEQQISVQFKFKTSSYGVISLENAGIYATDQNRNTIKKVKDLTVHEIDRGWVLCTQQQNLTNSDGAYAKVQFRFDINAAHLLTEILIDDVQVEQLPYTTTYIQPSMVSGSKLQVREKTSEFALNINDLEPQQMVHTTSDGQNVIRQRLNNHFFTLFQYIPEIVEPPVLSTGVYQYIMRNRLTTQDTLTNLNSSVLESGIEFQVIVKDNPDTGKPCIAVQQSGSSKDDVQYVYGPDDAFSRFVMISVQRYVYFTNDKQYVETHLWVDDKYYGYTVSDITGLNDAPDDALVYNPLVLRPLIISGMFGGHYARKQQIADPSQRDVIWTHERIRKLFQQRILTR